MKNDKQTCMMYNNIIAVIAIPLLLLVYGYAEDSHIWDSWVNWLKADNIPFVIANIDRCGTVKQHAAELSKQIDSMHVDKVNIVAHSKGGLDARWYIISHFGKNKIANLIMIATPNQGTTASFIDLTTCGASNIQALEDLQPGSDATLVKDNPKTRYFTISGNYAAPCYFVIQRFTCYIFPSDGLVTVSSAQSSYQSLGVFPYNHTGLVSHKDVFEKVLSILR